MSFTGTPQEAENSDKTWRTSGIILSRASETGSPKNRSGSDKTRGQGSFGPSTGGHIKHLTMDKLDNHLDKKKLKKELNPS